MIVRSSFICALLFVCTSWLLGGNSTKTIVASYTPTPPQIDGLIDEAVWDLAIPSSGFIQFDPHEGQPPSEQSHVRILYDDRALYIAVMCYDREPDRIVKKLTRRDRSVEADRFTVIIDSYHDHTTAFVFSGFVSGVQSDGVLSHDGRLYNLQWDGIWRYAAEIVADGWSAEFEIPFSTLRFNLEEEMVWGINFRRYIARRREISEWVMIPRHETGGISKIGHLSGLKNVRPPSRVELIPYAVSGAEIEPQPSPFRTRRDFLANAGFDFKLGLSNTFTLSSAVNPDFGQVEVDQAIINLTVFETHYPEKRPFFLEGQELFAFGTGFDNQPMRLFYSRRIGQRPHVPSLQGYVPDSRPNASTILGAAKLTGRTDGGLTIGALGAITDREHVVYRNIAGERTEPIKIAPRSSYNVFRLRQEILSNSAIGFMATSTYKEDLGPAYSGGVDWNLRFARNTYIVEGYFAGSQYLNRAAQQIHGSVGKLLIGRMAGEEWLAFSGYDYASKKFWINDLGFFNKPRDHGGFTQIILKDDKTNGALVRRYRASFQGTYRWNFEGKETVSQFEFQPQFDFTNFWYLTLTFIRDFPAYDDRYSGIIGLYRRPTTDRFMLNLITDTRRRISATLDGGYVTTSFGARASIASLQLTLQPTLALEFTPGVRLINVSNEEAWVFAPGGRLYGNFTDPTVTPSTFSLYGDRDYNEIDLSLRGILTLSPKVSLQFFTQMLLDKGKYRNFRRLVSPTTLEPYDYESAPFYVNPNFNEKTVNANLIVRWEFLPGSTFFIVWTHYRYGDDGLVDGTFGRNFSNAMSLPADNAFLLKVSYWWNL